MSVETNQRQVSNGDNDDLVRLELVETLLTHWKVILKITAAAVVLAVIAVATVSWNAPTRSVTSVEFSLGFSSASEGKYPNGLEFSASDITATEILDLVYANNGIVDYCPLQLFRESLYVERYSPAALLLDLDYQGRLADIKLTVVQREQLEQEYIAKRAGVAGNFRLVFVRPTNCHRLPAVLTSKIVSDVLRTWAEESESKRGVSNIQLNLLTPAVFDVVLPNQNARLIRADLVRTALRRVMGNATELAAIPGADLVRYKDVSLAEIRARMADLSSAWVEPLVLAASATGGRDAAAWVENALNNAHLAEQTARSRSQEYLKALSEFSGVSGAVGSGAGGRTTTESSRDGQAMAPLLDRTFVDRMLEMSEAYIDYRKGLTTALVESGLQSVSASETASYYQKLLTAIRNPGPAVFAPGEVDARIDAVVAEAKRLTLLFNDLYLEVSRVMFRPSAGLYQVLQPVHSTTVKAFDPRWYVLWPAVAGLCAFLGALVFYLSQRYLGKRRPA